MTLGVSDPYPPEYEVQSIAENVRYVKSALDAFLRFAYRGDIVEAWPSDLRARLLANADPEALAAMLFPDGERRRPSCVSC